MNIITKNTIKNIFGNTLSNLETPKKLKKNTQNEIFFSQNSPYLKYHQIKGSMFFFSIFLKVLCIMIFMKFHRSWTNCFCQVNFDLRNSLLFNNKLKKITRNKRGNSSSILCRCQFIHQMIRAWDDTTKTLMSSNPLCIPMP